MHAGILAAAVLAGSVSGTPDQPHLPPHPDRRAAALVPRITAAGPTDLWVTVDESGIPSTVTPVATVVKGSPTILSGAPHDLTASAFREHYLGVVTTRTGEPPLPAPTGDNGAGAFPLCQNREGKGAPFCNPEHEVTLFPGHSYYVTWDPTFFNGTNTTVVLSGTLIDPDTMERHEQAFKSSKLVPLWSFYTWTIDRGLLPRGTKEVFVALTLTALTPSKHDVAGPVVRIARPEPIHPHLTRPHTMAGPGLYIGLPVVFGSLLLLVLVGLFCNRQVRHIDVKELVAAANRSRKKGLKKRGQGFGSARRREELKEAIQLMEREPLAGAERLSDDEDDWERGWNDAPGRSNGGSSSRHQTRERW